jgi:CheY-like chemotaxis protein
MPLKSRSRRTARTKKKRPARKRAAKAAAVRSRATERAASPVETALAAFAHEVRTPLTGILAVSDLLATSELGERERRWVETIKAGAEHLAGLATLFVDAARSGKPGLEIRQDVFDLRALARNTGASLAGRAAARGLKSSVKISASLAAFAIGDPVRLRAALENLVDNAVKFTDHGEVSLKVRPTRAPEGKIGVAFAVSDSGIGLSQAEIKHLFRPFSQANLGIASRFGGAGLGLSSVRQFARAMGGDIAVTQRRSGGVTFTLTVVLTRAKERTAIVSQRHFNANPTTRPLRILSVEDNPFSRVVLNAILTELGHQAEFIARGEPAPERVLQGRFDAVLMDMVLPGIDGVETIRQIRALDAPFGRIAIIGVSGRADDETAARVAGANAFLLKPMGPQALATVLLEVSCHAAAAT